mmetsp:Transcript_28264/g.42573  ORF Transcript_28264/g.42573 Transcript_28264/m.42573 type:complete len:310 (-) Transcript_28264:985-1914(-)
MILLIQHSNVKEIIQARKLNIVTEQSLVHHGSILTPLVDKKASQILTQIRILTLDINLTSHFIFNSINVTCHVVNAIVHHDPFCIRTVVQIGWTVGKRPPLVISKRVIDTRKSNRRSMTVCLQKFVQVIEFITLWGGGQFDGIVCAYGGKSTYWTTGEVFASICSNDLLDLISSGMDRHVILHVEDDTKDDGPVLCSSPCLNFIHGKHLSLPTQKHGHHPTHPNKRRTTQHHNDKYANLFPPSLLCLLLCSLSTRTTSNATQQNIRYKECTKARKEPPQFGAAAIIPQFIGGYDIPFGYSGNLNFIFGG